MSLKGERKIINSSDLDSTEGLKEYYKRIALETSNADRQDSFLNDYAALTMRDEDYQRSLATTQSSLMQDAGMSRAAALAALQGGGESSPADLSIAGTAEQNRTARWQTALQGGSQIATALGQLAFGGISAYQNKQLIDSNTYLTRFREQGDIALSPVMGMFYDASNSTATQPSDNNVTDLSSFQEWCRSQPETSPYKTMVSSPEWRTLMATPYGADAAQRWFFGDQGPRGSVKAREDLMNYTRQQLATTLLLEGRVAELGTNLEWLEDKYEDYQKLRDAANNEALQRLQNDLWELEQYADPVVRKQKLRQIQNDAEYNAIVSEFKKLKQSEFYKNYLNDPRLREVISAAQSFDELGIPGTGMLGAGIRGAMFGDIIVDYFGRAAQSAGMGLLGALGDVLFGSDDGNSDPSLRSWARENISDQAILDWLMSLAKGDPEIIKKLNSYFGDFQTSNYTP